MPAPPPGGERAARAAWLYHVEGLTQAAIAGVLGVPRARVIALLAEARERGFVRVRLHGATAAQQRLEGALLARFGLHHAIVAPAPVHARQAAPVVGFAAGQHLTARLHEARTVAVGWGATLHAALAAVPAAAGAGASVVSLLGGALESRAVTPFEVARRLADLLGAQCHPLNAPLFVASEAVRDSLWAEPALREVRRQARAADLALLSVGDLSDAATLFSAGLVPHPVQAELRAAGAVGDVLGHFIDAQGQLVDHPLNRRVMAVPLADLAQGARLVLASGGRRKVAVLRAALRALPVAVLVTDEAAARGLLGDE